MVLFTIRIIMLLVFKTTAFNKCKTMTNFKGKENIFIFSIGLNLLTIFIILLLNKFRKLNLFLFYDSNYTMFEKVFMLLFIFWVFDSYCI